MAGNSDDNKMANGGVRIPRWLAWVVGICLTTIVTAAVTWAASVDQRTAQNRSDMSAMKQYCKNADRTFSDLHYRLRQFDSKIDNVNDKIDAIYKVVLEQQQERNK